MSKKQVDEVIKSPLTESIDPNLCLDDWFPNCDGTRTHSLQVSEILNIPTVKEAINLLIHLAREQAEEKGRREEREKGLFVSWDTAEARDNWVVQFWKKGKGNKIILLTELNKNSDEGGNFFLHSLTPEKEE